MNTKNVSRNDPCPCGSGKKWKKCCAVQKVKKFSAKLITPEKSMNSFFKKKTSESSSILKK